MKKINLFTLSVFALVTTAHASALFFATALSSPKTPAKSNMTVVDIEMIDLSALSAGSEGNENSGDESTLELAVSKPFHSAQKVNQYESHAVPTTNHIEKSQENLTPRAKNKVAKIQTTESATNTPTLASNTPTASQTSSSSENNKLASASQKTTSSTSKNNGTKESKSGSGTSGAGSSSAHGATSSAGNSNGSSNGNGVSTTASISKGQVSRIAKQYPEDAELAEIEGVVWLEVVVSANGRAKKVNVLSSPHRLLSNAARRGAQNATYQPALLAGNPVEARLKFSIAYIL